jgi:hypothetical protein
MSGNILLSPEGSTSFFRRGYLKTAQGAFACGLRYHSTLEPTESLDSNSDIGYHVAVIVPITGSPELLKRITQKC